MATRLHRGEERHQERHRRDQGVLRRGTCRALLIFAAVAMLVALTGQVAASRRWPSASATD